jgi:uncharacterized protein (UPF0548 family)
MQTSAIVQVGKGRVTYRKAQGLLKGWKHFQLPWASTNEPAVQENNDVVVTAKSLFLWSCNPLRISFVAEGSQRLRQAGGKEIKGRVQVLLGGQPEFAAYCTTPKYAVTQPCRPDALCACPCALWRLPRWLHAQRHRVCLAGHRLAFAHATLKGHQISGEERFAVEWHPHDDSVWCVRLARVTALGCAYRTSISARSGP